MSKIASKTQDEKMLDTEFKIASATADIASSQKTMIQNMSTPVKSNKNLFIVVFVALVINLVLTVSLAGALVSLNDATVENQAQADTLSAIVADQQDVINGSAEEDVSVPVTTAP